MGTLSSKHYIFVNGFHNAKTLLVTGDTHISTFRATIKLTNNS